MAIKLLGLVFACVCLVYLGYGPVRLILGRPGGRATRLTMLAYGLPLGMTILNFAVVLYGLAEIRFSLLNLLPLLLLPGGLHFLARRRDKTTAFAGPDNDLQPADMAPRDAGSNLLPRPYSLAILIAAGVAVTLGCLLEPIAETDAVAHWALHAKIYFYDRTVFSPFMTLGGAGLTGVSHCPPLYSITQTWLHLGMGQYDDLLVKLHLPLLYLAMLICIHAGMRRFVSSTDALALLLVPATLPAIIVPFPAGSVATAYADVPLALFIAGVTGLLIGWCRGRDWRYLLLAALLAAGAIWIKREGLAFAGVATVVVWGFSLIAPRGDSVLTRWRRLLSPAGFTGILVASFLLQAVYKSHFPGAFAGEPIIWGEVLGSHGLNRALASARYLLLELFKPSRWGFLWILVAGLLVIRHRLLGQRTVLLLLLLLLGQFAAIVLGMTISEFEPARMA
ncbi:MAG: hypothetical protein ABIF77_16860, partial [bacterium]